MWLPTGHQVTGRQPHPYNNISIRWHSAFYFTQSHVIKLVYHDTLRLLRLARQLQPGDIPALLTATTGVAAYNIGGMTVHSSFLLHCPRYGINYLPLSQEKLNSLQVKLDFERRQLY